MFLLKLAITNAVIIACVMTGRRYPQFAGLIATMPLTSLAVLLWLYSERTADPSIISEYVRGVFWGIWPTIAFFGAVLLCLRQGRGMLLSLSAASACWLAGALLHRFLIRT